MDPVDSEEGDWHEIRVLDDRIQQGEVLKLTDDVRDLLTRTASTVAIPEGEARAALTRVATGTALLHEIRRRITEGSNRLADALHRMHQLEAKGEIGGARQQLRDVISVEVVPLYLEIADGELARLNTLSE